MPMRRSAAQAPFILHSILALLRFRRRRLEGRQRAAREELARATGFPDGLDPRFEDLTRI
jgi:hypothetical protein